MIVSLNKGTPKRPRYIIALIGIPKKVPLIWGGTPPHDVGFVAWTLTHLPLGTKGQKDPHKLLEDPF